MTYILSFLLILLIFAAMAIGLILNGKAIRGSCGGLNCKLCTKPKDCPRHSKHIPS